MRPNFLVVGAAKAGTTWLYSCLRSHPDVFVPLNKEIHFFSYGNLYSNGIDWYENFFSDVTNEIAIGEISPSYLSLPDAAERIFQYNPHMKLIFILRDPIQRAYSHYCMALSQQKVSSNIELGMTTDIPQVTWSLYYQQVLRFTNLFPLENMKFVIFEDLKTNPDSILEEIFDFIGVQPSRIQVSATNPKNKKKPLPKYPTLSRFLRKLYGDCEQTSPHVQGLLQYLRAEGYFNFFHRFNHGESMPEISERKRAELSFFFQEDIENLSNLIEKDLSHWNSQI